VSKGLAVDKAICACRRDGPLVQLHGFESAALDTSNLGADQRCAILEVLWTIRREGPELSLVLPKCFAMLGVRIGAHRLAPRSAGQRGIEVIFCLLQQEER